MKCVSIIAVCALVASTQATTIFSEDFADGAAWAKRWVASARDAGEEGLGAFVRSAGTPIVPVSGSFSVAGADCSA